MAPYGAAAVEALRAAGLWETIEPKLVYANNVNQTRQFVESGNAQAAITAYSLVLREPGLVVKLDPQLYKPVDQAIGIVASSQKAAKAKQFVEFVLGARGRAILAGYGVFLFTVGYFIFWGGVVLEVFQRYGGKALELLQRLIG